MMDDAPRPALLLSLLFYFRISVDHTNVYYFFTFIVTIGLVYPTLYWHWRLMELIRWN